MLFDCIEQTELMDGWKETRETKRSSIHSNWNHRNTTSTGNCNRFRILWCYRTFFRFNWTELNWMDRSDLKCFCCWYFILIVTNRVKINLSFFSTGAHTNSQLMLSNQDYLQTKFSDYRFVRRLNDSAWIMLLSYALSLI